MSRRRAVSSAEKVRRWEYKNLVHGRGYYDKSPSAHRNLGDHINSQGFEAMRISPRTATKFGRKYRVVYGAQIEPDYKRPVGRPNKYGNPTRFGAEVTWHKTGYIRARKKQRTGTVMLQPLRSYPVDQQEARSKLMLRSPKRRRTRRKNTSTLGSVMKSIFG